MGAEPKTQSLPGEGVLEGVFEKGIKKRTRSSSNSSLPGYDSIFPRESKRQKVGDTAKEEKSGSAVPGDGDIKDTRRPKKRGRFSKLKRHRALESEANLRHNGEYDDFLVKKPLSFTQKRPGPSPCPPNSSKGLKLLKIDFSKLEQSRASPALSTPPDSVAAPDVGHEGGLKPARDTSKLRAEKHATEAKELRAQIAGMMRQVQELEVLAAFHERKAAEHSTEAGC